ncbi:hypothetical protein SKAU_G00370890 [Synaphobranchus kaupii]|uniref:Profilin n=1 Tax=Synaphobranchus kaupii TaxID=118154 RepID=A0A9Q1EG06_SYNKA|nr:hypothetical protein SKAU_G00370890 [Synaphobranchus kaupii]
MIWRAVIIKGSVLPDHTPLSPLRKCSVGWARARAVVEYKCWPTSSISLCNFAKVTRTVFDHIKNRQETTPTMSWQQYVDNLMADECVADVVIVGCEAGKESVWASNAAGTLGKITPEEIRKLVGSERSSFFTNGASLAGYKCTVLRDTLCVEGQHCMDMRTKSSDQEPDTCNITIGKTRQALVIAKGKKDAHGGRVNEAVYKVADYLRKANF